MVTILTKSAKMATPDPKGHDVIIFGHDVINKVLLRDSNYIEDVVM